MPGFNIVTLVFSLADRILEKAFLNSGKLDLGLVSAGSNGIEPLASFCAAADCCGISRLTERYTMKLFNEPNLLLKISKYNLNYKGATSEQYKLLCLH